MKAREFIPPIMIDAFRNMRKRRREIVASQRYSATQDDYNANLYWQHHHRKHGSDSLIGVGHGGLTEKENAAWYISAKYIFKGMLLDAGISRESKVLELGYGTGFYSHVCAQLGISDYVGIDIVSQHAEKLRATFPGYKFDKADIGSEHIDCPGCDLVYMLDVSQHIVNDEKMIYCLMNNVNDNIRQGGLFVITDELENKKYAFYEKSRSIEFYQSGLKGMVLEQMPILFRDKYIFSFRKQ
ncbi:class I SAM-dependent methyltransferase [Planctomycetota bacterium]